MNELCCQCFDSRSVTHKHFGMLHNCFVDAVHRVRMNLLQCSEAVDSRWCISSECIASEYK
jgi:hypothetical protein